MKIIKVLFVLAVIGLLLVAGLVAFVYLNLGSALKQAVERGGTYATQTETTVDSAALSFTGGGSLSLDDVEIDNPSGFDSPYFLAIDRAESSFSVSAREVGALTFRGIDLHIDGIGEGSNHATIMRSLKRLESGGEATDKEEGGEMGVVIRSLVFEDVTVNISNVPGAQLIAGDSKITIPRVEINDLGERDMTWGEMFNLVIKALMSATIEAGGGILPPTLLQDLSGSLADLESLKGEIVTRASEQVREAVEGLQEEVGDAIDDAADQIGDGVKDAIGNILGGNKDDDGG